MMEEVDAGTNFVKDVTLLGNTAPVFLLSSVGDNFSATEAQSARIMPPHPQYEGDAAC